MDTLTLVDNEALVIEDGVIRDSAYRADADTVVDADGQFLMPGFIDAHVHFRLATLNFARLSQWTEVQFGIAMAKLAEDAVRRGFTTVRDLGGDVVGLKRAISSGMVRGPRIVQANLMISQTGGHGDVEAGTGVQDAGGLQLWALSPNGAAAGAVVDAYYAGAPWGPAWDAAYGYFKAVDSDAFLQCHPLPADPR
jgi:imidazolonepropionase-like amidohydrolase